MSFFKKKYIAPLQISTGVIKAIVVGATVGGMRFLSERYNFYFTPDEYRDAIKKACDIVDNKEGPYVR